jgi:hypothetical protein
VDQFLISQTSEGALDSSGTFTLSPKEARQKMKMAGLPDPAHYALKFVQAAVAAGCDWLDVVVERTTLRFRFAPCSALDLTLEHIACALMSVATLPQGWLRHLAVGVNAATESFITEVLWQTPKGSVILGQEELRVDEGRGSFELVLRKSIGWKSLLGTQFAGEYAVLTRRCRFAPLNLTIDGRPVERPFPNRYGLDSGGTPLPAVDGFMAESVRPGKGLFLAQPSTGQYEEWAPGTRFLMADGGKDAGCSPLVLLGLHGVESTVAADAVVAVLPLREERGDVTLVKDGVTLEPFRVNLDRFPRVGLVADASELSVDLTEFQVVEDRAFGDKMGELQRWTQGVLQALKLSVIDHALARLEKVNPQVGYDIVSTLSWIQGGDISEPRYPLEASWGLLGRTPLAGEMVLLSIPAVKRFALSFHRNCRAIATNRRLIFWDADDQGYSWTLTWDKAVYYELVKKYSSDLYLRRAGEPYLEMAMHSPEDLIQMRALIEEQLPEI